MATVTFRLRSAPAGRIDLGALLPVTLAGQPASAIERLSLRTGREPLAVGDVFTVRVDPTGAADRIVIEGHSRFDEIGAGLNGGMIVVEGDCGAYAGARLTAGHLDIKGSSGDYLACGQRGGLITVGGKAGDGVGAVRDGHRYGMLGGTVRVTGDIGARSGDRMRRGLVCAGGRCGAQAGARMMGGTIIAEGGFGEGPGPLMRRGTLIAPRVERMLATFADCGQHDLVIMSLLRRHLRATLGDLAPKLPEGPVRRYAGDLATIGKGEILLLG